MHSCDQILSYALPIMFIILKYLLQFQRNGKANRYRMCLQVHPRALLELA